MDIPLQPNLAWQAELAFWVLISLVTVLIGIVIWFAHRFINKYDEREKSFDERVAGYEKQLTSAVASMQSFSADLQQSVLDFQKNVHIDLNKIQQQVHDIDGTLERVAIKAVDLEEKLEAGLRETVGVLNSHKQAIESTRGEVIDLKKKVVQIKAGGRGKRPDRIN